MTAEERFFYANSCEVFCSQHDAGIRLIRNVTRPAAEARNLTSIGVEAGSATVAETLVVSMSVQHLKTMVAAMVRAVDMYEQQFGELKMTGSDSFWTGRRHQP